jgi:phenylpropionate dioxygenase-like ring-hydroxylating dioxygenase large terminal subunit
MSDANFNFHQQWYPLFPVEDLASTHPIAATLLGRRIVIWKPPFLETYRVLVDECPHRLAPLSEGRLDEKTGHLMCSYHGWQFDEKGECSHIPQADHPELITKQRRNLCATQLPCQVVQGLLWVWADPNSTDLATASPLPLSPQIDLNQGFIWSSVVRDLEYDWQTLVENILDPSHVPFAHHGVQGNREQAKPVPIQITHSSKNLITASVKGNFPAQITFTPPCHVEYAINLGKGRQVGLVTYCIPTTPGKSRIVAQFPRNFAYTLHRLTPRWWEHLQTRNLVLDGDMILLHHQEQALQEHQRHSFWKSVYKLPTSADRFVIEFHNWFDTHCNGQLPWPDTRLPRPNNLSVNRAMILDRYQQHTLICSSCRQTLKTVKHLQIFLFNYFAVAIAIASLLPDQLYLPIRISLIISALLAFSTYSTLKFWLEPKFYFVDYVHANK